MKVKDHGGNMTHQKEKLNGSLSPKEIEAQLELINKNLCNGAKMSKNEEKNSKMPKSAQTNNKLKQVADKHELREKNHLKFDFNQKNANNNYNANLRNDNHSLYNKNCINNIDFNKNIITINKINLKELNLINRELKNEKKSELQSKKGEILNIYINDKFNYDKEVTNSIKKTHEYFSTNFSSSFNTFNQIKSNMEFPKEVINAFFDKKRNKIKEKNISNCNNSQKSSFGINPLEALKDVQKNLRGVINSSKSNKMTMRQIKVNKKIYKEQNIRWQKYIKSLPVVNCPDPKIFKLSQFYFFNKVDDDNDIKFLNGELNNKNINNNENIVNRIKDKEKEDSEEETINRHIKKKFINKKRNKS